MTHTTIHRFGVAAGACAIAAAGALVSAGDASAASQLTYWEHGNSKFEMTVSDTTPQVGDTITIGINFQRKASDEYIYEIKTLVPSCLRYIEGSAGWGGSPSPADKVENQTRQPVGQQSFLKIYAPSKVAWVVQWNWTSGWGSKKSASSQYYVTQDCATGVPGQTSMHYGGSLGDGTYQDKGPTITVAKPPVVDPTTTPGGGNPGGGNPDDGGTGSLDTGSLGGLFG